ncbi:hypothetical protein AcW1_003503 [Taiwanofungus camphoratus]|nr:hypothetical protein AcV5_002034 [Antrodia cinnamomea]KAI0941684.1 hypothetical protein AcW1_003503 [Antrodia cinnamomea]KAI0943826.1 hypothetical protein AcV7_001811 [Antrodia cinnamomea]
MQIVTVERTRICFVFKALSIVLYGVQTRQIPWYEIHRLTEEGQFRSFYRNRGKSQCSKNTHASGYDHEIEIGRAIFQSRALRMGVNSMDFTTGFRNQAA